MNIDSFDWERDDHYVFSEITLMPYDDGHYWQTWLGNHFIFIKLTEGLLGNVQKITAVGP